MPPRAPALAAVLMFVFLLLLGPKKDRIESAILFALFALALYIPGGYYMELIMYRRRQKRRQQAAK